MGLETFVALIANGVGVGAAATAVYGVVGAAALQLGASFLASSVASLFARKPQQQELKRELKFPTSRPAYRFPYGRDRVPGTPLPYPVVGEYAYACWLISSRPTDGGFTVWIDNREVELTGDPYDFTLTGGATATEFPFLDHLTIWIGRGDQTQPPQVFLDEAGYVVDGDELLWKATDAGQGCTMVFARMKAGDNGQISERWPSVVPAMELEGRMSKVWDMRDPAQDFNDPDTWLWSENAALCGLDLHTQNPFRPYELRNIELNMWTDYADIASEVVPLKSGGSEPRYVTSGVIVFDGSELEALVAPLLACGGARLVQSGGQRGVVPAAPRTSAVTVSDSLEGLAFSSLLEDASLITELRVNYSPTQRGGEPAELTPWAIPGALAADGGQPSVKTLDLSMVPSATQAQRLRNISGYTSRLQRTVQLVAPPSALKAVAGSVVLLNLPEPYGAKMNGLYEVMSIGAATHMVTRDGLAMRCLMVLREYSDAVHIWTPATDEEDVVHVAYDSQRDGIAAPGVLSVTSGDGVDQDTGGSIIPRFLFQFDPSTSASADQYEWQWRLDGGDYQSGGTIPAASVNGAGKLQFYLNVADLAAGHDVRVRTLSATGRSDYTELLGAFYQIGFATVSGSAGLGAATFTGTAPESSVFAGVRVYRSEVGAGFGAAVASGGFVSLARGAPFSVTAGDATRVNELANGDFAADSDWTKGVNWSIGAGVASKVAPSGSQLSQSLTLTAGAVYRVGFEMTRTAGNLLAQITGAATVAGPAYTVGGAKQFKLTAPAAPVAFEFNASNAFAGTADNAVFFRETPDCLAQGAGDYWLVPVTLTGFEAAPSGPITLNIS